MTDQLKKDIRIIIEVLLFLIVWFGIGNIYNYVPWAGYAFLAIGAGAIIYRSYFFRYRKDAVLFPTQNDDSSKMLYVALGIMVLFCAIVGYFVANANFYKVVVVLAIGVAIILFGVFESPKGWLVIKDNTVRIYRVDGIIDIRQIKEIALHSDRIILITIRNEQKLSTPLKLTPAAVQSIKAFLESKIARADIVITDHISYVGSAQLE